MTQTLTFRDPQAPIAARVRDLLDHMTLAEKIGQMAQVENLSITPQEVTERNIGSVLSGGGGNPDPNTPATWAQMVLSYQEAALQTRLGIPLLYGSDAVHGHSNVRGAVIFPHNIGLGSSRDPDLVQRVAHTVSIEAAATGVNWAFAPALSVPQDIRWGRTYEGYSENAAIVSQLGVAHLRGLQNWGDQLDLSHPTTVLGSPKHFVGDGGTSWGSSATLHWMLDQGVTEVSEDTLRAVHLPPFAAAIGAGARNIMISLSSWDGLKLHAHKYLLTDVLKRELGFTGFLVSDWEGVDQTGPDYHSSVAMSINAGVDMVMVPYDGNRFIACLTKAVESAEVSLERIDDAARRILQVKFELGLFETPFCDKPQSSLIGSAGHRLVAREAVRKSLVLLKNDCAALPLPKDPRLILVAGEAADNIGLQCGGWTVEWQGGSGSITPGTTLLMGMRNAVSESTTIVYDALGEFGHREEIADYAIVVLSEMPYAEGMGDRGDLTLLAADVALVQRVRPLCKRLVVILLSGRPLIVTDHLDQWDAFVAAWLPGTEGQGIADVLFGDHPFMGRLSFSWPRSMDQVPLKALRGSADGPLFPYGHGLV